MKMSKKKYDHAFTIAFSLKSDNEAEEVTEEELLDALRKRVYDIEKNKEVFEAVGLPFDTFENV